jgi:hypothetical protein
MTSLPLLPHLETLSRLRRRTIWLTHPPFSCLSPFNGIVLDLQPALDSTSDCSILSERERERAVHVSQGNCHLRHELSGAEPGAWLRHMWLATHALCSNVKCIPSEFVRKRSQAPICRLFRFADSYSAGRVGRSSCQVYGKLPFCPGTCGPLSIKFRD